MRSRLLEQLRRKNSGHLLATQPLQQVQEHLRSLMQAHRDPTPRSRAQFVRERLMEAAGPTRALLRSLVQSS